MNHITIINYFCRIHVLPSTSTLAWYQKRSTCMLLQVQVWFKLFVYRAMHCDSQSLFHINNKNSEQRALIFSSFCIYIYSMRITKKLYLVLVICFLSSKNKLI